MISRLVSLFSPANVVLFSLPNRVLACRYFSLLSGSPRRGIVDIPFSLQRSPEDVLREIRAALALSSDDTWAVGLPLNLFTLVNLTLPAAAMENMDQAVRYALMRHVPHDLSQSHVAYRHEDRGAGLEVQALVASRSGVQDNVGMLQSAGVPIASVFPSLAFWAALKGRNGLYFSGGRREAELILVRQGKITLQLSGSPSGGGRDVFFDQARTLLVNQAVQVEQAYLFESDLDDEQLIDLLPLKKDEIERLDLKTERLPRDALASPYQINLVSTEVRRRKRFALRLQAAALGFVLSALLLVPLAHLLGKGSQLQALEKRIEEIRPQAERVSALRLQGDETLEGLRRANQLYAAQPDVADLLRELTEVLPGNAWLTSFQYSGGQIRVQGVADSATSVIEAVENSPLFREVGLDSPVTKSGARDSFQISATLDR